MIGTALMPMVFILGIFSVACGTFIRFTATKRELLLLNPTPAPVPAPAMAFSGAPAAPSLGPVPPAPVWERSLQDLSGLRWQRITPRRLLFGSCTSLYLIVGAILSLGFHSYAFDAQARLANAWYVLYSRDPHLGAIGFVWNPLPSILVLPLLPFKVLWPALATHAYAGVIVSALCMSGAVCVMAGILDDLGVHKPVAPLLVGVMALNPMVIYYGSNGMSEALFLLTLMMSTRYLLRWLATDSLRALALAGTWLGVSYLARNEALAAAAATLVVVVGRSFWTTKADRRTRTLAALADAVIVGAPVLTSFAAWNAASYIITGHPFQAISGNAVLVELSGSQDDGVTRASLITAQALTYAPVLPVLLGALAYFAWRARDPRPLVIMAVLGAVLAFAFLAYVSGQTFPWLRYTIVTTPLALVAAALLLALLRPRAPAIALGLAATLAVGVPVNAWAMLHDRLGAGEVGALRWVVHGPRSEGDRNLKGFLPGVQKAARYMDGLKLEDGSVLVDNQASCVPWLILNSKRPHQFIIPNDRDFERTLADPRTFGADYILVPKPEGIDMINSTYPGLYEDGAALAELKHEFKGPGCTGYRLYEITASVTSLPGQDLPSNGRR